MNFKLWIIYTSFTESWTRELASKLEAEINNPNVTVDIEIFDNNDSRLELYGWENFPIAVALKYDQPFQKRIGKLNFNEYIDWLYALGWKI